LARFDKAQLNVDVHVLVAARDVHKRRFRGHAGVRRKCRQIARRLIREHLLELLRAPAVGGSTAIDGMPGPAGGRIEPDAIRAIDLVGLRLNAIAGEAVVVEGVAETK